MQRIGRVLHLSSSKKLILKVKNVPRIGDRVFDENFKFVGIVFEILGPTASPYVAVKPDHQKELQHLVNHFLYRIPAQTSKIE